MNSENTPAGRLYISDYISARRRRKRKTADAIENGKEKKQNNRKRSFCVRVLRNGMKASSLGAQSIKYGACRLRVSFDFLFYFFLPGNISAWLYLISDTYTCGGEREREEKKGLSHFRFHQAPNGGVDSIEGGRTLAG